MRLHHTIVLVLALLVSIVQGWWDVGHMLVGEIAYQNIDPTTRELVDKMVVDFAASGPWPENQPPGIAQLATWADDVKSNVASFGPWHYIDQTYNPQNLTLPPELLRTAQETVMPHLPGAAVEEENILTVLKGFLFDVFQVMGEGNYQNDFTDRKEYIRTTATHANKWEKNFALAWLVHLFGDLHQPLHTISQYREDFVSPTCSSLSASERQKCNAGGSDYGGNRFHVFATREEDILFRTPSDDENKTSFEYMNLHYYWDSGCQKDLQEKSPFFKERPLPVEGQAALSDLAKEIQANYTKERMIFIKDFAQCLKDQDHSRQGWKDCKKNFSYTEPPATYGRAGQEAPLHEDLFYAQEAAMDYFSSFNLELMATESYTLAVDYAYLDGELSPGDIVGAQYFHQCEIVRNKQIARAGRRLAFVLDLLIGNVLKYKDDFQWSNLAAASDHLQHEIPIKLGTWTCGRMQQDVDDSKTPPFNSSAFTIFPNTTYNFQDSPGSWSLSAVGSRGETNAASGFQNEFWARFPPRTKRKSIGVITTLSKVSLDMFQLGGGGQEMTLRFGCTPYLVPETTLSHIVLHIGGAQKTTELVKNVSLELSCSGGTSAGGAAREMFPSRFANDSVLQLTHVPELSQNGVSVFGGGYLRVTTTAPQTRSIEVLAERTLKSALGPYASLLFAPSPGPTARMNFYHYASVGIAVEYRCYPGDSVMMAPLKYMSPKPLSVLQPDGYDGATSGKRPIQSPLQMGMGPGGGVKEGGWDHETSQSYTVSPFRWIWQVQCKSGDTIVMSNFSSLWDSNAVLSRGRTHDRRRYLRISSRRTGITLLELVPSSEMEFKAKGSPSSEGIRFSTNDIVVQLEEPLLDFLTSTVYFSCIQSECPAPTTLTKKDGGVTQSLTGVLLDGETFTVPSVPKDTIGGYCSWEARCPSANHVSQLTLSFDMQSLVEYYSDGAADDDNACDVDFRKLQQEFFEVVLSSVGGGVFWESVDYFKKQKLKARDQEGKSSLLSPWDLLPNSPERAVNITVNASTFWIGVSVLGSSPTHQQVPTPFNLKVSLNCHKTTDGTSFSQSNIHSCPTTALASDTNDGKITYFLLTETSSNIGPIQLTTKHPIGRDDAPSSSSSSYWTSNTFYPPNYFITSLDTINIMREVQELGTKGPEAGLFIPDFIGKLDETIDDGDRPYPLTYFVSECQPRCQLVTTSSSVVASGAILRASLGGAPRDDGLAAASCVFSLDDVKDSSCPVAPVGYQKEPLKSRWNNQRVTPVWFFFEQEEVDLRFKGVELSFLKGVRLTTQQGVVDFPPGTAGADLSRNMSASLSMQGEDGSRFYYSSLGGIQDQETETSSPTSYSSTFERFSEIGKQHPEVFTNLPTSPPDSGWSGLIPPRSRKEALEERKGSTEMTETLMLQKVCTVRSLQQETPSSVLGVTETCSLLLPSTPAPLFNPSTGDESAGNGPDSATIIGLLMVITIMVIVGGLYYWWKKEGKNERRLFQRIEAEQYDPTQDHYVSHGGGEEENPQYDEEGSAAASEMSTFGATPTRGGSVPSSSQAFTHRWGAAASSSSPPRLHDEEELAIGEDVGLRAGIDL